MCVQKVTYNGDLATELVFDLAFLDGIWSFLLDDLEELFDTHLAVCTNPRFGKVS